MGYQKIIESLVVTVLLLIAIYITITCPCEKTLYCHRYLFYFLVGVPLVYIFILNDCSS